MRRGLLGLLAVALVCGIGPARADSTLGSTTGVSGVLYDDCLDYPYQWSVDVPGTGTYRALHTQLVAPGGAIADTGYVVPDANVSSGTSTFFLCTQTDPYGSYTIRSQVEWGSDPEHIGAPVSLADSQFTLRKPRTRTSLSVSTRRPAYGQVVKYRVRATDERPTGYFGTPAAWVVVQRKVDGHWVRLKGGRAMTHATGYITVRLPYLQHHKAMRVRALTQPTSRYARSASPVVRIW
ncbi:hypothetical protein ACVW00_000873 [Marmoricola sp. URHA0025 HA25]